MVIVLLLERESIFHLVTILTPKILIVIKNQRIHWSLGRHHCLVLVLNKWLWSLPV